MPQLVGPNDDLIFREQQRGWGAIASPATPETEAARHIPVANPKEMIGSGKAPLHLWPDTASLLGSLALLDGAMKYGRSNFRATDVRATIYVDATRRHLARWFEGENTDPDSGLPHLAHVLACVAILVDAGAAGTLIDDRQVNGGFLKLLGEMTPHVNRLKEIHAHRDPKHYTIADNSASVG